VNYIWKLYSLFLDYLVSELEFYLEVKRAEQLTEELDYLNAIAFLDEIRASEEYRKLCK
jgi:hypothetical protein